MEGKANMRKELEQLRDLAYETGWIAGRIESGVEVHADYQQSKIGARNLAFKDALDYYDAVMSSRDDVISRLIKALREIANHRYMIHGDSVPAGIVAYLQEIAEKAL